MSIHKSQGSEFPAVVIPVHTQHYAVVAGENGNECAAGHNCGAAYVFRLIGNHWFGEQKLTAFDAAEGDLFGDSVSVSGDTVVVGARWDDCAAGSNSNCGSAYVFRFNGLRVLRDLGIRPYTRPAQAWVGLWFSRRTCRTSPLRKVGTLSASFRVCRTCQWPAGCHGGRRGGRRRRLLVAWRG